MTQSYIACVAGKSGGHIIPCISYAQSLKKEDETILFFSNNTPLDYQLIKEEQEVTAHYAYSLELQSSLLNYGKALYACIKTVFSTYRLLKKYKPRMLISTGGLISLPVMFAAWLLNIPTLLFELNATPGKAALKSALFATKIQVCFSSALPYFPSYKTTLTPYPLKKNIHQYLTLSKKKMRASLAPTLLIIGGSQGSVSLNTLIKKCLIHHPDLRTNLHIIHQTGSSDTTDWKEWYKKIGISSAITFTFCADLAPFYQQADLIITRAGAGSLFEIIAFKKQALIIPLEIKQTDHQVANGNAMVADYPHLCTMLQEKEIQSNETLLYHAIKQKL